MKNVIMKRVVLIFATLLISFMLIFPVTQAKADENSNSSSYVKNGFSQTYIGLDTILIGKIDRDKNGVPQKLIGFSSGIGIGYRHYFSKNTQLRGLHPYWEIGTWGLILPYGGIGAQYSIPLGGDETGKKGIVSFGAGAYLYTIIPAPVLTISYSF